jgi:hypothetical protein
MTRKYSTTSVATQLAATISNSATTVTVAAGTGSSLMGGVTLAAGNVDQFLVALDVDTNNEEIVAVTGISGDTLTVVRARAGSSAIAHTAGASVKHVFTGDDATFFTAGVATADGAIAKSLLTTKGDIIAATASATPARLGAGTNGQVLTVDSTQTPGLKWSTPESTALVINAQTGTTYSLVAGDVNKLVTLSNASGITLTIPNGVFTTGQEIHIQQINTGQVTVANDGTTSYTGVGTKLRAQYSAATIICTGTNTFTLIGDLA